MVEGGSTSAARELKYNGAFTHEGPDDLAAAEAAARVIAAGAPRLSAAGYRTASKVPPPVWGGERGPPRAAGLGELAAFAAACLTAFEFERQARVFEPILSPPFSCFFLSGAIAPFCD
jgi:hypothetical protein